MTTDARRAELEDYGITFGACWQCGQPDSPCLTGFGHCEEHEPPNMHAMAADIDRLRHA